mmetsp:Transcript_6168/g.24985  ORF Transcript_6168/g.24985 Transcript_6168/m.24985 type:complete len:223 (+) Transcript_6168:1331-1999(+)
MRASGEQVLDGVLAGDVKQRGELVVVPASAARAVHVDVRRARVRHDGLFHDLVQVVAPAVAEHVRRRRLVEEAGRRRRRRGRPRRVPRTRAPGVHASAGRAREPHRHHHGDEREEHNQQHGLEHLLQLIVSHQPRAQTHRLEVEVRESRGEGAGEHAHERGGKHREEVRGDVPVHLEHGGHVRRDGAERSGGLRDGLLRGFQKLIREERRHAREKREHRQRG